jgi:hypothetical protein
MKHAVKHIHFVGIGRGRAAARPSNHAASPLPPSALECMP